MVPNTGDYMILGYAVILGGMAVYAITLFVRCRRLRRWLADLEADGGA